jgi:hypothetical protein
MTLKSLYIVKFEVFIAVNIHLLLCFMLAYVVNSYQRFGIKFVTISSNFYQMLAGKYLEKESN